MKHVVLLLSLILAGAANADGFCCGTKLILAGDSVSRLTRVCGKPDSTFKANAEVQQQSRQKQVSVTQWVYQRSRNKDIVVSVRHGKVLKITRD